MSNFTQIENDLLEKVAQTKFNGTQYRIILAVWRNTYGWHQKAKDMSLTYLAEATNTHKKQIERELNSLIKMNVIRVVQEATFNRSRVIAFNEDLDSWNVEDSKRNSRQVTKKQTPNEKEERTVSENVPSTGSELEDSPVSELATQEINTLNKSLNKELNKESIPYSEIVSYLNEKAGKNYRTSTKKTQTLIKARWNEGFRLDDFKKVIDTKVSQWKHDPKMNTYLRPETLFGTKFEGYLNEKPITKRKSVHDIPTERPSYMPEPKPITKDELSRIKELEEELPF